MLPSVNMKAICKSLFVQRNVVRRKRRKAIEAQIGLDNRTRYIAQSILTAVIGEPILPSLEEARDIIAWAALTPVR